MDAEQDAHFQLMKRLLVIIPLSTILILLILCVVLGVNLYEAKRELRALREQAVPAMTMGQAASAEETGGELYTASGVNESRRDVYDPDSKVSETEDGIRKVYLTFDDGPSSNTGEILDILAEYDVKATFFVVGKEEEKYQPLYKRIVEEGHTLAMHSYSHKYNEIYQSKESYVEDLTKLQEFLYDTTGVWCRYCRFPGGSSNQVSKLDMKELIRVLNKREITYFDWNVECGDASGQSYTAKEMVDNVMKDVVKYHTSVVLLHDAENKTKTVKALPVIIKKLLEMDAEILPIDENTSLVQHVSAESVED